MTVSETLKLHPLRVEEASKRLPTIAKRADVKTASALGLSDELLLGRHRSIHGYILCALEPISTS